MAPTNNLNEEDEILGSETIQPDKSQSTPGNPIQPSKSTSNVKTNLISTNYSLRTPKIKINAEFNLDLTQNNPPKPNMSRSIFGFNSVTKWVTHQIGPMDTTHMLSIVRVYASEREASKCALILALGTVQHSKYTTGGGDFHFLLVRDEKEQDSEDGSYGTLESLLCKLFGRREMLLLSSRWILERRGEERREEERREEERREEYKCKDRDRDLWTWIHDVRCGMGNELGGS
ncbi:hypothetical protein N7478_008239 [Penicillium angulare]|uniref:uncharacterized protein n=1 Tax=Penicillium angulare TaxID=116970 RepID=UPI002541BC1E|nr:uncharacterized protein N7478_008239 [Penicillium angulare]KAJ5273114.1 hypothetical protein N7478_008239 [Penicillium angulare]